VHRGILPIFKKKHQDKYTPEEADRELIQEDKQPEQHTSSNTTGKTTKSNKQNTVSNNNDIIYLGKSNTPKRNWPQITSVAGKTFRLPPIRYILPLLKDKSNPVVSDTHINSLHTMLDKIHTQRYAPEPHTSHYQPMKTNATQNALWISLTNTSSRTTRPDIILRSMTILYQYKIHRIFIQEQTSQHQVRTYNVDNMETY
jgi:hypothetical protein